MLILLWCIVSFTYTFIMSGSLPKRSFDEMLNSLREGIDPSQICPSCNIIQSRAVHCRICDLCVADPNCQHSHLISNCITTRNRDGYISFVCSLLTLDVVLLYISLQNFKVEVIPGLQNGFNGPLNILISIIFFSSIGAIIPLVQLLVR